MSVPRKLWCESPKVNRALRAFGANSSAPMGTRGVRTYAPLKQQGATKDSRILGWSLRKVNNTALWVAGSSSSKWSEMNSLVVNMSP